MNRVLYLMKSHGGTVLLLDDINHGYNVACL